MSANERENENREDEYGNVQAEENSAPVIPEEEPDLVGRWVLRVKKLFVFLLKPLWKGLALFLAPLWKPFRKGADKVSRKDWILFFGMILAVALAAGTPVLWMKIKSTHREKERLYSLYLGERKYWEDVKFEIDENNRIRFSDGEGTETDATGWPFYYEDQDMMFWPFYGMWYSLEDFRCGRVECFSKIKYEYGKGCSIFLPDGREETLPGFLYDNLDTYVLMENATLSYNGQKRELPPLSYIRVYGNNGMDLFCYGQEEGEVIFLDSDPELRFGNGTKIDLKGDIMKYPNGITRMLFVAMEYIEPLGSE